MRVAIAEEARTEALGLFQLMRDRRRDGSLAKPGETVDPHELTGVVAVDPVIEMFKERQAGVLETATLKIICGALIRDWIEPREGSFLL